MISLWRTNSLSRNSFMPMTDAPRARLCEAHSHWKVGLSS